MLAGGYLVFNRGAGMTLGGQWSGIQNNKKVTVGGTDYNELLIYKSMPWAPTPGTDTFYISAKAPVNAGDVGGPYYGFPYVPSPEAGL